MKKIKAEELSNFRMVCGGEKKHDKIIVDGRVKQWVGMGWVDEGKATKADRKKYPEIGYE